MSRRLLDFKPEYDTNSSGVSGYLLKDSIPLPSSEGNPQAGDTNRNPDLGRRRQSSLNRHFNNPNDLTSARLCEEYWTFIQDSIGLWAQNAPSLMELKLEGTDHPPGLSSPLCPNLTAIVENPSGTQTLDMGGQLPNPSSSADTAGPDGTVNAHRDPESATSSQVARAFIEGRKTRWS